jgi:hypothetical protein
MIGKPSSLSYPERELYTFGTGTCADTRTDSKIESK